MKIDPTISNYIDASIERSISISSKITDEKIEAALKRSEKSFKEQQDHHLGALKEFFEDKMAVLTEYCSSFPTRDEVRAIVREEIKEEVHLLEVKLSIVTNEITEHRRKIEKHDKRITKLEHSIA